MLLFPVVKTEAASGDCPLQGLLNCLKEIPGAQDTHPSPSGAGEPRLQEDPGAWRRNSGGKGTGCTGRAWDIIHSFLCSRQGRG